MGLTYRQQRFAEEYCVDGNATSAASRAGYSETTGYSIGSALLKNIEVLAAIEEQKESNAQLAGLSAAWVLKRYMEIATADPNELVEIKVAACCRHCWGIEHAPQMTESEFEEAVDRGEIPDASGGFGFDSTRDANGDCPVCLGGTPTRVICSSTRKLKGAARKLYAGAKQGRNGIEIKMRDQDTALKVLASYTGVAVVKNEVSGPGGSPLTTVGLTAKDLTEEQLVEIIGLTKSEDSE